MIKIIGFLTIVGLSFLFFNWSEYSGDVDHFIDEFGDAAKKAEDVKEQLTDFLDE